MKTMISTLKSLILINFVKKFRLAAGPLPGVALSGEQPPAARCAGAKTRKMLVNLNVFVSVFRRFSPTLADPDS